MGIHRTLLRLLEYVRRHRSALHLDIRSYFASVDLGILRTLIRRRVRDRRMLLLIDRVLASGASRFGAPRVRRLARMAADWPPSGRGLPIGARTSQLFAAQVYLNAFDHYVKREMKVPAYLRYVDDLYLFADSRADLRHWRRAVAEWLERERGLNLKSPRAPILSCHGSIDALGQRIRREGIEPLPRRPFERIRAHLLAELDGSGGVRTIADSISSRADHILFGCGMHGSVRRLSNAAICGRKGAVGCRDGRSCRNRGPPKDQSRCSTASSAQRAARHGNRGSSTGTRDGS